MSKGISIGAVPFDKDGKVLLLRRADKDYVYW